MAATIQTIQKPTKARALDTSGNNNHGQIYSGRGLEFDGVTDYLDAGVTAATLGITNDVTVACWVKSTDAATSQYPFNFYQSTSNAVGLKINSDTILIFDDVGGGDESFYATTINDNTWYRVTMVIDSLAVKLYLNGVLVGSGSSIADGLDSYTSNFYIGNRKGSGGSSYFTGMLSDVQVWDAAWTADDVLYDYNNPEQLALNRGGTSLTNSNLKIWYPMNDGHRGQQSYILDASNTGLGDDTVTNGDFSDASVTTTSGGSNLAGWTNESTHDGTHYWEITNEQCRLVTNDGTATTIKQSILTIGITYKYSITVITSADGFIKMQSGSAPFFVGTTDTTGTFTGTFTATHADLKVVRGDGSAANDITFDNLSIKPVNNKNHATTVFHGDELVTNGSFSADSDWNKNSNWSIGSGVATADGTSSNNINQNAGLTIGRQYIISFDITAYTSGGGFAVRVGSGSSYSTPVTSVATHTVTQTCEGNGYLYINADSNVVGSIDNVSIKEVGTATGWTDADQQLQIPQTALQSYNQLAWFDGVADNVQIADHNDFSFGDGSEDSAFSISAWINMNDATLFPVIGKFSSSHREWVFLTDGSDKLYLKLYDQSASVYLIGQYDTALTSFEGQWLHVVSTYDATEHPNGIKIYINGESKTLAVTDNGSYVAMENKSGAVTIGANLGDSNYANGTINEVSIWGTELSQTEINELYNDGKAFDAYNHSNRTALQGYWRNNGLATWQDLTANNRDGTPTSLTEIMLITAGADATRDSQGFLMNRQRVTNSLNYYPDVGGGSNLNIGAQTKVSGSPLTEAQLEAMTVTLWFKSPDYSNTDALVNVVVDGAAEFIAQVAGNGRFRWTYEIDGFSGSARHQTNSSVFSTDKWTFVAFALDHDADTDANRALCYVGNEDNAVSLQTNAGTQTGSPTSGMEDNSMWIGGEKASGRKFVGEIDDVCVYSKTLTLAEITRNFNAGKRSHR